MNLKPIFNSNQNKLNLEVNEVLLSLDTFDFLKKQEQISLFKKALQLCEKAQSYSLLIALLRLNSDTQESYFRADSLAMVLNIVDESHPLFRDLIKELSEGERLLVLGILIEASRLEPDNDLRLLRLKRLTSVIPKGSRSLYWSEAEELSRTGGDDAQLALLGIARQLPKSAQASTFETLKQGIRKVANPYKKAMAFALLSDFVILNQEDIKDAKQNAAQIPSSILQVMAATRLQDLKSRASE